MQSVSHSTELIRSQAALYLETSSVASFGLTSPFYERVTAGYFSFLFFMSSLEKALSQAVEPQSA